MLTILSSNPKQSQLEEVLVNSGKKSHGVSRYHVHPKSIIASLIFVLLFAGVSVSWSMIVPVSDSTTAIRDTSGAIDEICRVFVDCTGLRIPDSVAALGRMYLDSTKPGALRHVNADIFAYCYFDNDLIVKQVSLGTFLPEGTQSRDPMMDSFLRTFRGFLEPAILGKAINPKALSFPGGRPGSTICVDGYGDVDTSEVDGLSMWMPRSGCLVMHFKFVSSGGGITLDRRAVVSFKHGL